ncbi:MAG: hypothetical protein PHO89_06230 [Methylacidiphilaceae bacterium]|nr:hypothetical protein [Candidatus Methylacidiphilaceae bacterium]
MPLDPEGEEAFSKRRERDSGARQFSTEGSDEAEERLGKEERRSLRWRHSAQRKRDRKRFLLLLLLLAGVLYILWKQCRPYLPHGVSGAQ